MTESRSRRYRVPVKGATGEPSNLIRHLSEALQRGAPGVTLLRLQHDPGCPAVPSGPLEACTCETVDVEERHA